VAEEKTETRVDETLNFIRQCVSGRCDILDLYAIRDAINEALASHAPSAPKGNLVQLAAKVISKRDAWWKRDRPPDSQERDDFLGAIADLTEAVLHVPAAHAASATGTEKE